MTKMIEFMEEVQDENMGRDNYGTIENNHNHNHNNHNNDNHNHNNNNNNNNHNSLHNNEGLRSLSSSVRFTVRKQQGRGCKAIGENLCVQ